MRNNLKNQVVLVKDGEKYIFLFDQADSTALLRLFGRFASDPQLNFSWHDAAAMARKVKETSGALPGKCLQPGRESDRSLPGRDR